MDLKKYKRTRYQNIYQNIKNKNYVVMISKPVKTSISSIDGQKIYRIEEALKIRDNPKIRHQKATEIVLKDDFDSLWNKYIDYCKYQAKFSYNTILRKQKSYNKYLKGKIKTKLTKLTKIEIAKFIDKQKCSNKQKNELLSVLKSFFNWCVKEEYLLSSPAQYIDLYKTEKTSMKYWTPTQFQQFIKTLNDDIENDENKFIAYRTKIFTLIGFSLGNRTGETRALTFDCFDKERSIVYIKHSINYDPSSNNFLSNTKNWHSQREIVITPKLIEEIEQYKYFLINEMDFPVKSNDLIFFNYLTNRPITDTTLRKYFYRFCEKADVPKIRMYDLRHTYVATMMAEGKELYHISERIGHSNYSTTVNKYGHLSNEVRKEIAKITDKYY